jgi:hypothetical protein
LAFSEISKNFACKDCPPASFKRQKIMRATQSESRFIAAEIRAFFSFVAAWVLLLASAASSLAVTHYVDLNSANPSPPYTNWASAATVIQEAVDAAVTGDEIVVTNGNYSHLRVTKPLSVRSLNGPRFTTIDGGSGSGCVYLASGANLSGFALTNGFAESGAGVYCESATAMISNCILAGNFAINAGRGGGAYQGTLNNCILTGNSASYGGGAYGATLNDCTLSGNLAHYFYGMETGPLGSEGGGANACVLNRCTLEGNVAAIAGGVMSSTLNDCTLSGNSAIENLDGSGIFGARGGGAESSTLNRCMISSNSAPIAGGASICTLDDCTLVQNWAFFEGSGASQSALHNSIIYSNVIGSDAELAYMANYAYGSLDHCCSIPLPSGNGNIAADPLFVDLAAGNLRLQSSSPCINAGDNGSVTTTTDLDGNPRILGGTVDIGAYEFVSPELLVQRLIELVNESSLRPSAPCWRAWKQRCRPLSAKTPFLPSTSWAHSKTRSAHRLSQWFPRRLPR